MIAPTPISVPRRVNPGDAVSSAWANQVADCIDRLARRKHFGIETPRIFDIPSGAFYGIYSDSLGDTYLQGGTVTGGNGGSESIADYKVIDADTGITSTAGTILYLQANVSAVIEDDIMLPGCTLNTASLATGASVPDNDAFTVASPTGDIYAEVGRWIDGRFLQSEPAGNYLASGTVGYFVLSKS